MVGKLKPKGKVIADRAALEKTIAEVGYADAEVNTVRHNVKSVAPSNTWIRATAATSARSCEIEPKAPRALSTARG